MGLFYSLCRYLVTITLTMARTLATSIVAFILLGILVLNINAYKSYSKYQLWRLHMKNNEHVAKMLEFSRLAHLHDINFWSEEFRMNVPVS